MVKIRYFSRVKHTVTIDWCPSNRTATHQSDKTTNGASLYSGGYGRVLFGGSSRLVTVVLDILLYKYEENSAECSISRLVVKPDVEFIHQDIGHCRITFALEITRCEEHQSREQGANLNAPAESM